MPRYFFHVHDGISIQDSEGTELADVYQAHSEAIVLAGELLREAGGEILGRRSLDT